MKKQGRGIATIMFGFGYGEGFPVTTRLLQRK
jgi:hypothetical protein